MSDIVEYAQREMATFSQAPLSGVDSLIFSQLSYMGFGEAFPDACSAEGRSLHDAFHAERFDPLFVGKRAEGDNRALLVAIAASPRYRDVKVCRYTSVFDKQAQTQFCAMTFILPDGAGAYIAFRGTDSSLVGWRESFNLAFSYPVPGQVSACAYLNEVANSLPGPLFVGGHSKGGNLAVYAATQCAADVQDRIVAVFDHDAPGFAREFYDQAAFKRVEGRIRKTMPENALVGMLMETIENYRVVRSRVLAVRSHDPFTWEVDVQARDFSLSQDATSTSGRGEAVLNAWIEPLDSNQRAAFVDTLFQVLEAMGVESMRDLATLGPHEVAAAAEVVVDTDAETRHTVTEVLVRLLSLFVTPRSAWDLLDALDFRR